MLKQVKISDDELERKFRACELKPAAFTHEAHVRLAWIHIDKYGLEQAEKNLVKQVKQFAEHLGEKHKFNKTLTIAAVKIVYHFKQKSVSKNFNNFLEEFPRLKTNFKELLAQHFGFDIYNNELAKQEYLQPDLLPFDKN